MGRVSIESFWLRSPDFADVLVRREPLEGFEPSTKL